jgi:peptide/nickel transport system ATP-binding protein
MIEISSLHTSFKSEEGNVRAVDGVDLTIKSGEKFGLIGETGCGKTVLGMSIVRLLPASATLSGSVWYKGKDILICPEEEMRSIRGKEISFILQNPTTSLNPVIRVGDQIAESIAHRQDISYKQAYDKALSLMKQVNFPDAEKKARKYPHELSGGMKQKVMIAIGLSSDPSLLIADEPTKALDRGNKAEILDCLTSVSHKRSMLMITHDLMAAEKVCDRIGVMYCGEIVEEGPADEIFNNPLHPYTTAFIQAQPRNGSKPIPGMSPSLIKPPSGCRFHPRCLLATEDCINHHPEMVSQSGGGVRCHCLC